jgi:Holliday junction resolvase|tara:strand:- start:594 stop:968 length:375 start_codon:yes stop_codon:yes gene_type:complete
MNSSMSSRNKAKGSRFENLLEVWLIAAGYIAQRLARAGKKDVGDLHIRLTDGTFLVIEAKAAKSMKLPEWLKEAAVEAENHEEKYGAESYGVVVSKCRGKGADQAYAIFRLVDLLEFLRLKGLL